MQTRKLGKTGPNIGALGLGCMSLSGGYGPTERSEGLAVINAALDAGVTLLDTGDFYAMGHNEMLLAEALQGRKRESYQLSVKFGALRGPDGSWGGMDTRPAALKTALAYSLQRLRTDYVDVYRPARLDPNVPIEETIGAIADMVKAGYVRHIGLSEVGVDTIRRAHAVHPICDLQIEYAVITRSVEQSILPLLRELGIAITAYGVLSRGLISAQALSGESNMKSGFRAHGPRFQGDNLQTNLGLVAKLQEIAAAKSCSVAQLAIAWVAARGDDIIPLSGARTRAQLTDALGAMAITLTPQDLAAIDAASAGVAGTRYAAEQMHMLDSER